MRAGMHAQPRHEVSENVCPVGRKARKQAALRVGDWSVAAAKGCASRLPPKRAAALLDERMHADAAPGS
jgi:hypothetical protein